MSAPREKLPRTSPLTKRAPRAASAFVSSAEESRRRTTVLPAAIPRYSAVTSRENLPTGVLTSVVCCCAESAPGRAAARAPAASRVARRLILLPRTGVARPSIPDLTSLKPPRSSARGGQQLRGGDGLSESREELFDGRAEIRRRRELRDP